MSVLKDFAAKRFWLCAALTAAVALLVLALGAWLTVIGFVPPDRIQPFVCVVWAIAGVCAGICAAAQKEKRLLHALLTIGTVMAIFCCTGLTAPAGQGTEGVWWIYVVAALAGRVLGVLLPCKRKRRSKTRSTTVKKR